MNLLLAEMVIFSISTGMHHGHHVATLVLCDVTQFATQIGIRGRYEALLNNVYRQDFKTFAQDLYCLFGVN